MIKKLALIVAASAFSFSAYAQTIATDNASQPEYTSDTWAAGDNGGSGFGAWTTVTQGFIGSSTQNGGTSLGIDTAGVSFGLFSNTNATGLAEAIRPFGSALTPGQTFSLDFDNGFVAGTGSQGFSLLSGTQVRFEFYFQAGGTNTYKIDGLTIQETAHGFTADGMQTSLTLTSADTFSFTVTYNSGTPTTETFTGTLDGTSGAAIDNFRFFNFNPTGVTDTNDSTAYFNSPTVVPEPSSLSLLAGPAILGAWFFVRRRRA